MVVEGLSNQPGMAALRLPAARLDKIPNTDYTWRRPGGGACRTHNPQRSSLRPGGV